MPWKAGVHPVRRDARRVRGKSIPTRIGSHCNPSTQPGPSPTRATSVHDGGSLSPPREGIFFGANRHRGRNRSTGAEPLAEDCRSAPCAMPFRRPTLAGGFRCREPNRSRQVNDRDWLVPLPWNLSARLPTLPSDGRVGNANQLVFSHVKRLTFVPAQSLSAPGFLWANAGWRHECVGSDCSTPQPCSQGEAGGRSTVNRWPDASPRSRCGNRQRERSPNRRRRCRRRQQRSRRCCPR